MDESEAKAKFIALAERFRAERKEREARREHLLKLADEEPDPRIAAGLRKLADLPPGVI